MKVKYHKPKNTIEKITEVYCFVSVDERGEGIIGHSMEIPETGQQMMMPFVCADKARMESLKPLAKKMSLESGMKVKLIKLTNREELEVI